VKHGAARQGRTGKQRHALAGYGEPSSGEAWQARLGTAGMDIGRPSELHQKYAKGSTAMAEIVLERIQRKIMQIRVVGVSPLIPHKWSEKALRMMRGR
jgi:hypothetical protein